MPGTVVLSRSPGTDIALATLLLIAAAALAYLFAFDFERSATVRGYIASSKGLARSHARDAGVLSAVFVDAGDRARAGEPLFEVQTGVESSEGLSHAGQRGITGERLAGLADRRQALKTGFDDERRFIAERLALQRVRLEALRRQRQLKEAMLTLAQDEFDRLERLHLGNYVAGGEIAARRIELLERRNGVSAVDEQLLVVRESIGKLRFDENQLPIRERLALDDLSRQAGTLEQALLDQSLKSAYVVRAPVSGVVSTVHATVGDALKPRAVVATILPSGTRFTAHLLAPSSAIGLVHTNEPVSLRLDAFPYRKFGTLGGRIAEIGGSAYRPGELAAPVRYTEAVYRLEVDLERDFVVAYGERHPLKVDMTLSAELGIERRRLIDWLLDPLRAGRR